MSHHTRLVSKILLGHSYVLLFMCCLWLLPCHSVELGSHEQKKYCSGSPKDLLSQPLQKCLLIPLENRLLHLPISYSLYFVFTYSTCPVCLKVIFSPSLLSVSETYLYHAFALGRMQGLPLLTLVDHLPTC
jgi:hypothetical protein